MNAPQKIEQIFREGEVHVDCRAGNVEGVTRLIDADPALVHLKVRAFLASAWLDLRTYRDVHVHARVSNPPSTPTPTDTNRPDRPQNKPPPPPKQRARWSAPRC